jgi:colanic acid biosynthesis glycosyl transferase WcaI
MNYLPETTSIGPYTADLAEYLQEQGHKVTVVTSFPMIPYWQVWEGYRGKLFQRETINGVTVLRTYVFVPEQPRKAILRILYDMSFSCSALLGGLLAGKADVVVAISPPLQLGLTGWLLGILKHASVHFHIQDLVPDAAVATGVLSENSQAVKIGRFLERLVYKRVSSIGVICDGFVRNLHSKQVPDFKIKLLPNYIDLTFMQPQDRYNSFRIRHQISKEQFVVMYSGGIALKQGLQTMIEVAAELKDFPAIVFYLVGDGPYLTDLKARALASNLTNFHFLPLQPRDGLSEQLSAADVLVITQKRAVTDIVFPGKLLYYMAVGRPLLAAVSIDSETGRFIRENGVGIVTAPEEAKPMAAAILDLYNDSQRLHKLGEKARQVVEIQFEKHQVLRRFTAHLESLAAKTD